MIKNEGVIDRMFRVILGEIFFIIGYFWLWGNWQLIAYILSAIMFITAITGFCGVYKLLGVNTDNKKSAPNTTKIAFVFIFIVIVVAGSYFSNFFSRKFFLDDYNRMNNFYKQTLFYTGQDKREESVGNYIMLVSEYAIFSQKYLAYHPYAIKDDEVFDSDLRNVSNLISAQKENINTGDLRSVHLDFELIRQIFQGILKRNGFSNLQIYLVDFHEVMEKIITYADAKSSAGIIAVYPEVSDKLEMIEEELNDNDIKTIRQKLEDLLNLAKEDKAKELPEKASELKSSFVKVYLVRG